MKQVALQHVAELRGRVAELTAMADTLQDLAERCHGDDRPDCPILRDLAEPGAAPGHLPTTAGHGFRNLLSS